MSCYKQEALMILACFLWGSSYLFMKEGLGEMSAVNLVAWRFGLAFLIPCLLMWKKVFTANAKTILVSALPGALLYLVLLFVGEGVKLTSASNASFLIGTSVVVVPILSWLLRINKLEKRNLCTAGIVVAGVWLLTGGKGMETMNLGDVLCILSAVIRAIQILVTDKISQKNHDMLMVGLFQLGWASLIGFAVDIFMGSFDLPRTPSDIICLSALALLCTSVGFILQAKAQEEVKPERLAVIFATEPVFTAVLSIVLFGQFLSSKQSAGAVLILAGLLVSSGVNRRERQF